MPANQLKRISEAGKSG